MPVARAFIPSTRRPTNAQTGFLSCGRSGGWPAWVTFHALVRARRGTRAARCWFMAQVAKAAAGPLDETLTRRLYHDAGEAKFHTKARKGSLGIGCSRGFAGDDGRCISNRTHNE
jgi:hypothetical protein